MVVRVLVAGGTGVLGRRLVPRRGRGPQGWRRNPAVRRVLRAGRHRRPGRAGAQAQFPLVGGGTGYSSWVHLDDAAGATVLAIEHKATGVFNIVDEPAPASEWLPYLAACAGVKRPMRVPVWLARLLAGEAAW